VSEHDFEPVRGLPGDLPDGEHILWQGAPDWRALARHVFHVPLVAFYFAGLMAWRAGDAIAAGAGPAGALVAVLWVMPPALAGLGLLAGLAWLNSRTTVYTITNRRVVMRFGAALTKAINIPFAIVESADVKLHANGAGDVAISLKAPDRISYFMLWPHARPGKLAHPQPTLRCVPNAVSASEVLANALRRAAGQHPMTLPAANSKPAANPVAGEPALA
jgi:hypothetical protein